MSDTVTATVVPAATIVKDIMTPGDHSLLSFLKANPDQWFSTLDLAAQMGKSRDGEGQKEIIWSRRNIVKAGHSVPSSRKGYMYSNNIDVLKKSIAMYRRKISGMNNTIAHLNQRVLEAETVTATALIKQVAVDTVQ